MQKMKVKKKKDAYDNKAGKRAVAFMVIVLAIILSSQILRLHEKNEAYKEQQAHLEQQLADEEQRAEELQKQEEYVGSDEYVEDTARQKLGMANDDEIIFKEK